MKRLLIICSLPNDTFIYNMAKWLKEKMDISIDVLHYADNPEQTFGMQYYDNVHLLKYKPGLLRAPAFRHFSQRDALLKHLNGKHYDIIHCHAAIQATILSSKLKSHCDKLFITFWGGEIDTMKVLYSNRIYNLYLKRFLKKADAVMNSASYNRSLLTRFPFLEGHTKEAYFGSVPLEQLFRLMKEESREESKVKYGIEPSKRTVLIGYSGKAIHNHIPIIMELSRSQELKQKLHLLAPMTRGGKPAYIDKVEECLKDSGFTYTLLRDRFLSDEDIARLRNATDIALQLSEYDGFSRSILECFGAGSIVIYGSWLDYDKRLEEERLKGIRIGRISDIASTITDILTNPQTSEEYLSENRMNVSTENLWENCIDSYVKAYCE